MGYNTTTGQMLAIKKFKNKNSYQRERDIYKHIKKSSCSDLILNLLEYDDDKLILVMERGMCDLRKFAE